MAVVGLPVVVLFFVEEDVADDLYDAAEAAGLDAMIRGLSLTQTDPEILALTLPLFDGLYSWLHRRHPP